MTCWSRCFDLTVDEILEGRHTVSLGEIYGDLSEIASQIMAAPPNKRAEAVADARSELRTVVERYVSEHMKQEVTEAAREMEEDARQEAVY